MQQLLSDLLGMMGKGGPQPWDFASQFAISVASEGNPEANIDPLVRMEYERLAPVAQLHVEEVTGFPLDVPGTTSELRVVTRQSWAREALEAWRPLFSELTGAIAESGPSAPAGPGSLGKSATDGLPEAPGGGSLGDLGGGSPRQGSGGASDIFGGGLPGGLSGNLPGSFGGGGFPSDSSGGFPAGLFGGYGDDLEGAGDGEDDFRMGAMGELLARWLSAMQPMLVGLQLGYAVGHLARHVMGRSEVPLPWEPRRGLLVVAPNVEAFAGSWDLPLDEMRLWVLMREMISHAIWQRPTLSRAFRDLAHSYARSYQERPEDADMMSSFEAPDLTDPDLMERLLDDPASFLGSLRSQSQRELAEQLRLIVTVIDGFVEFSLMKASEGLLSTTGRIEEALRRARMNKDRPLALLTTMFGVATQPGDLERGRGFVSGVVQRGGQDQLRRLWYEARMLPKPPEVEAPGLWLARLEMEEAE